MILTIGIILIIVVLFTTHKTTHKNDKREVKEMVNIYKRNEGTKQTEKIENNLQNNKNYSIMSLLKTGGYPKKVKTRLQKQKRRGNFVKNISIFKNYSLAVAHIFNGIRY